MAQVRADAARYRDRADADRNAIALLDDALRLLDRMRIECADLQQRYNDVARRLAAREAGARTVFDALPQPIVTTDATGIILDANDPACALLARSRAKLKNDLLLHFAEDRAAFSNIVRALPQATDAVSARLRLRPTDRAPFEAALTVHRDPRVEGPQFLWVMQPVERR